MVVPALLSIVAFVSVVVKSQTVPNSFPHDYPGKPNGDYSPAWQDYFLVKESLPNVTTPLSRNWAGSVSVDRAGHPNDTLFFWAFESKHGSLTSKANENSNEPWGIWLNGGPGASSLLGLLLENGPLRIQPDHSLTPNNYSWDKLTDYFWVDQPVGTGYSTADTAGYIADEDQMGEDFLGFLTNIVKVFPSLAKRPLLLTGESYAGTYIPYIMKALYNTPYPPVKVSKIAMGNAAMGSLQETQELPAVQVIETYPQLISYDPDVYKYFREQSHLCGYDINLTYPQSGHFPDIQLINPTDDSATATLQQKQKTFTWKRLLSMLKNPAMSKRSTLSERELQQRESRRKEWIKEKRDLTGRANGSIDPFYGCFLGSEIQDYALNFSFPWSATPETEDPTLDALAPLNPYDIPDARAPAAVLDPTTFLNDNRTRAALHAPTSKDWLFQFIYPFGSTFEILPGANAFGDPSVEPVAFFDELASNLSAHGTPVVIYSGNDDSVVAHISSEITIQNTTFGGIQGFTKRPSTPFTDEKGKFAGIVHQERNWTYALIANSGHQVPEFVPEVAFFFYKEFILGNNRTGLVTGSSVIGGEDDSLLRGGNNVLPGQTGILYGSGTATSLFVYPASTIGAWETFIAMAETSPDVRP